MIRSDLTAPPTSCERGRRSAAEESARDEAVHVVERRNRALAAGRGALWSPTIRRAVTAGTGRVMSSRLDATAGSPQEIYERLQRRSHLSRRRIKQEDCG